MIIESAKASAVPEKLLPDRILALPTWLPDRVRRRLSGRPLTLITPRMIRRAMRVSEKIPGSEWAERYRVVTAVDAAPGRWRPELVPHAKKIMDTYTLPWVEEIALCAVERAAKTNIMLNCMGWAIDCDPGNVFYLMPTEATSDRIVGQKIIPMIEASPRLARRQGKKQVDTSKTLITFNHGITLFPAHANSASSMASFYGKHSFGDEVDKYPERTGKETDPITLIRKRGRDRRGSKRFFASTPAQKFIWKLVQASHQIWEYELCCPDCGGHFIPKQDHVSIPPDATVEQIEQGDVEITLACPCCGGIMDEAKRTAAYRWGRWTATKGGDIRRPAKVGFHLPAWGLPTVPLTEIASAIVRAKTGDLAAKIALSNGYAATDHKEEISERKEDYILRLRDDRPEGLVPPDTFSLLFLADTQDNGFWYTVRAWGYGETLSSRLVKAGFVDTLSALEQILFAEYKDAAGGIYRIHYGGIDTQGHRTAEIYAWCKKTGVMAMSGAPGRKAQPVTVSNLQFFPGSNKPIPGGLQLYHFDTHFHKDALSLKLQIEPSDPGAFLLHSGFTADQLRIKEQNPAEKMPHNLMYYAQHCCAEGRDERGLWVNPTKRANHLFDCEVMGLALAMYLGFQYSKKPDQSQAPPPEAGPRMLSSGI